MNYEMAAGLMPAPDGTVVAMVTPHKKTVYFERQTDRDGGVACDPPKGWVCPEGYRLVPHPRR